MIIIIEKILDNSVFYYHCNIFLQYLFTQTLWLVQRSSKVIILNHNKIPTNAVILNKLNIYFFYIVSIDFIAFYISHHSSHVYHLQGGKGEGRVFYQKHSRTTRFKQKSF